MQIDGWKERLKAAIEKQGKTMREVSLAAGKAQGYVHSLVGEGKDPSVENLAKICEAANVSLTHVLYGFEITPETEKLLQAAERRPDRVQHLLAILAGDVPDEA